MTGRQAGAQTLSVPRIAGEGTRRDVLLGLTAAALAGALPRAARATPAERFLGGRLESETRAFATAFDTDGRVIFDIPLPDRVHAGARRPGNDEAVLMARRPGTFGLAIDLAAGTVRHRFGTVAGRWFNGHGVFIGTDRLMATETVAASGEGVIGVYDASAGYARLGEFPAGGLEPHDIGLLADGVTLAIANGGLIRNSDRAAEKLNVATMTPSLTYVDCRDGRLLQRVAPPPAWHKLGIRHLAVALDDTVGVVMQYEGGADDAVPLIALHRRGAAGLTMVDVPAPVLRALRQYCGAAAFDRRGEVLCVTSPPGNSVLFWDRVAGEAIATARLQDGCGIAHDRDGGFVVSSGLGGVLRWLPELATTVTVPGRAGRQHWDNHLVALDGT